jgi:hypothetical protein
LFEKHPLAYADLRALLTMLCVCHVATWFPSWTVRRWSRWISWSALMSRLGLTSLFTSVYLACQAVHGKAKRDAETSPSGWNIGILSSVGECTRGYMIEPIVLQGRQCRIALHCISRGRLVGWLVRSGQALLVKEKEGCVCACSSGRGGLYPYCANACMQA